MPRDSRLYLDDILESCRKIRQFTHGMSFEEFGSDPKTQDAVIRNFEVIGEAARRLPDNIKSQCSRIEWARIVAFRNILVHEYFGINLETVWTAIQDKIPVLEEETKAMLGESDRQAPSLLSNSSRIDIINCFQYIEYYGILYRRIL